jgi:hypothetical protein
MADPSEPGVEQAQDGSEASALPALPSAAEELSRPGLAAVPIRDFDTDHTWRYHEAMVQKVEIEAKQADEDRAMRKEIATNVFKAIRVQVIVADVVFVVYGFWKGWHIPGSVISAWLGATVVQVIAVGLVIARSLFPLRGGRTG